MTQVEYAPPITPSGFPKIASAPSGGDDAATLNAEAAAAAAAGKRYWLQAGLLYQVGSKVLFSGFIEGNGATIQRMSSYTAQDRTVGVESVTHVTIQNLLIDGQRAAFSGGNLGHNLGIYASDDVRLINVRSFNARGDGFYLGYVTPSVTHNTHIRMFDCIADNNYRNNLSVTDVTTFRAYACTFSNANGVAPQSGIDIEPSGTDSNIRDVLFVGGDVYGSAGNGVQVVLWPGATGDQAGITFIGTRIYSNALGLGLYTTTDLNLFSCYIEKNTGIGLYIGSGMTINRLTVLGGRINSNGTYGLYAENSAGIDWEFIGVQIRNNSAIAGSGVNDGARFVGTTDRITLQNCSVGNDGGTGQRVGVLTAATITNFRLYDNDLTNNTLQPASLADDGQTRRVRGNKGQENVGAGGGIAQPAIASSTSNVINVTGYDCSVYIAGGTVSGVSIGNQPTGLTGGMFRVPAGQFISITYTVAPVWKWFAD